MVTKMNPKLIAGLIVLYLVIGYMAVELGFASPAVEPATEIPNSPEQAASLWDKIASILAPLGWAFNAVAGLFQLASFQTDGVPPMVNSLIFLPMGMVVLISGIRLIRGGG